MRRFFLSMVLLTGGLVAAVWYLRVEQVRVVGASTLSARMIVEASGIEPGDRILWERLSVAERRIERMPAVADAVAERSLPSTVVLRVVEREPLARLDGADALVVDSDGVMFPVGNADVRAVLYGWKGRPRAGNRVDARSRVVLGAMRGFPRRLVEVARELRIAPVNEGGSFTLIAEGRLEVRFGSLRDLEAKADVAMAILAKEQGNRLAYVDVRSPTVPVSRRFGATPPPATAAPGGPAGPGATPSPAATEIPLD